MKINKFGAIAASALVVAALAVNASAANPADSGKLPLDDASVKAVKAAAAEFDWTGIQAGGTDTDAVRYTIMETEDGKIVITAGEDVDLSGIDWSVVGEDGENVTVTYSTVAEDGAVSVAAVYPVEDADGISG